MNKIKWGNYWHEFYDDRCIIYDKNSIKHELNYKDVTYICFNRGSLFNKSSIIINDYICYVDKIYEQIAESVVFLVKNFEIKETKLEKEQTADYKEKKYHLAGIDCYIDAIENIASENPNYDLTKKEIINDYLIDEKIYEYDFFIPEKDIKLIEEVDNKYDENAISVFVNNEKIGYIKKGSCKHIKTLIKNNRIKSIDLEIFGGKYKAVYYDEDDDTYEYIKDSTDYKAILTLQEFCVKK